MTGSRLAYPTDLSQVEWAVPAPLVPPPKPGGRPPKHPRREIIDALAYWGRAGCAWRLLPHGFPPWQTVCHYWRQWRIEGCWEEMPAVLRAREPPGPMDPPAPRDRRVGAGTGSGPTVPDLVSFVAGGERVGVVVVVAFLRGRQDLAGDAVVRRLVLVRHASRAGCRTAADHV